MHLVFAWIKVKVRESRNWNSCISSSVSPPALTAALVAHSIQRFGSSRILSSSKQESGERRGETTSGGSLGIQLEVDSCTSSRFSTQMLLDLRSDPIPEDLDPKKSAKGSFKSSLVLPLILLLVLSTVELELLLLILACINKVHSKFKIISAQHPPGCPHHSPTLPLHAPPSSSSSVSQES